MFNSRVALRRPLEPSRAALVGVVQQADLRAPSFQRHLQRLDGQVAIVDGAHGPADHKPREQVEDDGEIELAARADDKLGRVPDPALIRRGGFKLPVEEIRGHRLVVFAHRGQREPFAGARLQAVFLHQPDHALPADLLVLLHQIRVNTGTAIPLLALGE